MVLQAMDFLNLLESSHALAKVCNFTRETVPFVDDGRFQYPDIKNTFDRVRGGALIDLAE